MFTHPLMYALAVVILLFAAWIVAGYLPIRNIEQPRYQILEVHDGYELRKYDSYILAEVTVEATEQREALNRGFMLVADYIFGNNTTKSKLAMTAPVVSEEKNSEKIAMTSPVISNKKESGEWTVAFVMPSQYSLETLPAPNNAQVQLREVPTQVLAARRFSWVATNSRIENQKEALRAALREDSVTTNGNIQYAGYNPPLTIPFMQRHEVLVEVVPN